MANQENIPEIKAEVLGHPSQLFVLFFTEMWERFSYYGMRAILVIFLVGELGGDNPGWGWDRAQALSLLGTYAFMVYLTPIVGGWLADNKIGYRNAVVIGALLMTLGHASMAMNTPMFLYLGIALLIFGNGFFKPNMTSIISKLYDKHPEKKDGAYTIFYMGVNAGAFLGIMLCGYLGEKVDWHIGFGLAGVFMLLGMIQFYLAQPLFGDIGAKPTAQSIKNIVIPEGDRLNPFTMIDKVLIGMFSVLAVLWILNDPLDKIGGIQLIPGGAEGIAANIVVLVALMSFLAVIATRLIRYTPEVKDKLIAVTIFAFFTIFFWAAFEQAAGTMPIFADSYTQRDLTGSTAKIFKFVDLIVTIVPLGIITWVLIKLFKNTFTRISSSNIVLAISFVIVWAIVGYKLYAEFSQADTEVPASWFAILNSLFIIMLAPYFAKWWESKYNPSAAIKYALGMILLGLGFAFLVIGALPIAKGAETASVSMMWLVFAYLFHTLGELCLSPVGLSYLSKLVPTRMIAFMFGIWYLAIAIGNKLAHLTGGAIDSIAEQISLSGFFGIFTIVPIVVGLLAIALNPLLKKLMHGVH